MYVSQRWGKFVFLFSILDGQLQEPQKFEGFSPRRNTENRKSNLVFWSQSAHTSPQLVSMTPSPRFHFCQQVEDKQKGKRICGVKLSPKAN